MSPKLNGEEEILRKEYEECVKNADDIYQQIADKASHTVCEAQKNLKEYKNNVVDFVQEKPIAAVLIAIGVGFVLSSMMKK